jgi:hypothetical protein
MLLLTLLLMQLLQLMLLLLQEKKTRNKRLTFAVNTFTPTFKEFSHEQTRARTRTPSNHRPLPRGNGLNHLVVYDMNLTPCPPSPENLVGIFLADEGQKLVDDDYEVFELRQFIDPGTFKDFYMHEISLSRKNWLNPNRNPNRKPKFNLARKSRLNPNRKPKKYFKTKAYRRACY